MTESTHPPTHPPTYLQLILGRVDPIVQAWIKIINGLRLCLVDLQAAGL